MLFAQITDTHIKANGRLAYGRVDTAAYLERCINHLNQFMPNLDAVLVSGDITDAGQLEEYAAFRSKIDQLNCPYYVCPGNHDNIETMKQAFSDHTYIDTDRAFLGYTLEDYPLRLVCLDTTKYPQPHGFLSKDRLEWLDSKLSEQPDRPTLIFMHHPPFETGIQFMDVQNLKNGELLLELLGRHKQVIHVACGHVHRAITTTINRIPFSIAPSCAHAITLDMQSNGGLPTFMFEPPMVRIFRFTAKGGLVSHLSFIDDFGSPQAIYTKDGELID